ncbi:high mobility group B protein 7-like [Aphidius gifuensis]|uniref:high mobility group B protein 7-like n=1 Tax=Aphidius gifuensis TaxID=684658 RepID=UPI001CDBD155|nr:high mobility group B protein 7-like [Aphidius gifuensis]
MCFLKMEVNQPIRVFTSKKSVENFIKRRERRGRYTYSTGTSKLITENVQKKRKYKIKEDLYWSSLIVTCTKGGKYIPRLKNGQRQISKTTAKINCPAHMKILPSKSGKMLELRSYDLHHTCRASTESDLEMTNPEHWSPDTSSHNDVFNSTFRDTAESDNLNFTRMLAEVSEIENDNVTDDGEYVKTNNDIDEDVGGDADEDVDDGYNDVHEDKQKDDTHEDEQEEEEDADEEGEKDADDEEEDADERKILEAIQSLNDQLKKIQMSKKNKKEKQNDVDIDLEKIKNKSDNVILDKRSRNTVKRFEIGLNDEPIIKPTSSAAAMIVTNDRKMKGRPAGSKNKKKNLVINRTLKFDEKKKTEKQAMLLKSVFGETILQKIFVSNYKVTVNDLPKEYSSIPDCFHDQLVQLEIIQQYFEKDAFKSSLTWSIKK